MAEVAVAVTAAAVTEDKTEQAWLTATPFLKESGKSTEQITKGIG